VPETLDVLAQVPSEHVTADLSLEGWWAAEARAGGGPERTPAIGSASDVGGPVAALPSRPIGRPRPRQKRVVLTRLWAFIKMAILAYTTWWAMGYLHAGAGEAICGYGAVCLFAGFGARWRRRFFGPGQLLEPELYEQLGLWLYRAGAVAVLAGGGLYIAQTLLSPH
jgi:hypothetical protein